MKDWNSAYPKIILKQKIVCVHITSNRLHSSVVNKMTLILRSGCTFLKHCFKVNRMLAVKYILLRKFEMEYLCVDVISELLCASKPSLRFRVLTLINLQLRSLRHAAKCHFTENCWHASDFSKCQISSLLSGGRSAAHIVSLIFFSF